jgi:hypothetical protein
MDNVKGPGYCVKKTAVFEVSFIIIGFYGRE